MQAAILHQKTLRIEEVPVPQPKTEQALVRLTTGGACHSDLHLVRGNWPLKPRRHPCHWVTWKPDDMRVRQSST